MPAWPSGMSSTLRLSTAADLADPALSHGGEAAVEACINPGFKMATTPRHSPDPPTLPSLCLPFLLPGIRWHLNRPDGVIISD